MDLFQAVFLGLLQGITEWLPISSEGQVMVAGIKLLGLSGEEALRYAIFLHLGTVASALVYFRKRIPKLLGEKKQLGFYITALSFTAITAIPSYLFLKAAVQNVSLLLVVIGGLLVFTGLVQWKAKRKASGEASKKNAAVLGLGQGFALLPGVSRSGVTTSVLLFEGFEPKKAFEVSFLLSIPTVLAGELVFGLLEGFVLDANAVVALAVAFVVGLISINALLRVAEKIKFAWFCIGFGLLYLALAFI